MDRPRPALLLAALLLLPSVALLGAASAPPALVPAILDLTGAEDRTTVLAAASLATPTAATGLGPGTHLLINMAGGLYGCTANFVWRDTAGNYYLGAAGHCFLPEGKVASDGPGADYNLVGTDVYACVSNCNFGGELGFTLTGDLVYLGHPTYARQTQNGADVGNDFGIVQIPSSLSSYIRPGMPVWGGPHATSDVGIGSIICHYGNGVGVGEVWPTMARAGVGTGSYGTVGPDGRYWTADLASAPGDSGSAIVNCTPDANSGLRGVAASGILTHLAPGTGTTAGTTIAQAINMVSTQRSLTISVVTT